MTIHQSTPTLKKYATVGAIALGLTLTANSSAWAGPREDVQVTEVPVASSFDAAWDAAKGVSVSPLSHIPGCVQQTIGFGGGSSWSLCVKTVQKFGLIISHASFKKSPASPPIAVLFDGRWGAIFVPYNHGGSRFHDIRDFNFPPLVLGAGDCPSPFSNPRVLLDGNTICRELRDTEIEWKDGFGGGSVRRGVEVVYTGVLGAANYSYIQEWAFRDDGTIACRAGSTGQKIGGRNDTNGHMHEVTWRLDFDLNGPGGDSVFYTRHLGDTNANDFPLLVTSEAGLNWVPTEFNTIKIVDSTLRNGRGRQTEYELIPHRTGTSRHVEPFTQHDFWVTRYNGAEILAEGLPGYVNGQPTVGQELVEWYTQSVNHEENERDEKRGTTPTLWTGFELVPNNLFDGTPFF